MRPPQSSTSLPVAVPWVSGWEVPSLTRCQLPLFCHFFQRAFKILFLVTQFKGHTPPPPGWPITTQISFAPERSLSPLTVLLLLTIHLPAFCVLGVLGIWGSLASPFLLCWFPLAFLLPALFSSVEEPLWLPQFHPSFLFWNDRHPEHVASHLHILQLKPEA